MSEVATISPQQFVERSQQRPLELVDVRTPVEFREVHATAARNVPLETLDPHAVLAQRNGHASDPLYVICRTGSRARQACLKFQAAGFSHVVNVAGGTQAWEAAGLPVVRGKKAISLERQVRIAAGFLVVLSAVLSVTVHLWFVALAAFVGGGLMFAGITDTCGMAMMLARMPWNQVKNENGGGAACSSS